MSSVTNQKSTNEMTNKLRTRLQENMNSICVVNCVIS